MSNAIEAGYVGHSRSLYNTSSVVKFIEADASLVHEIIDHEDNRMIFDKFGYIPYARVGGKTANRYCWYQMNSVQFSETKGSVVRKVNNLTFGGQYELIKSHDTAVHNPYMDKKIKNQSDWQRYYDFHKSIDLKSETYKSFAEKLGLYEQTNGMRAVEVIHSRTFGQDVVTFNVIQPDQMLFKWTGDDNYRVIALSPLWDDGYLLRHPAREIPVWPNKQEYEDGTTRTVVYQKSGLYKYYGRPDDIASFTNQYNEFKLNEFITKQIDSNFIAQTILEVESVQGAQAFKDPANPKKSSLEMLKEKFTTKGRDPSPVIPMTRPPKTIPFKAHDIKPNMSPAYYTALLKQFETSIHKANDLPKVMMMEDSGGFNSSQFMDAFDIVSATKIMAHDLRVGNVLNECLKIAALWTNNEWACEYGIDFVSPIQRLIDQKADADKAEKISTNETTVVE